MQRTLRFKAVDTFRGMAAIMVILFHMQHLNLFVGNNFIEKSDIFVDFFFVLSGFVITHSNYERIINFKSILPFVVRRFKRLYPLHLFTLLLVLSFEVFRYFINHYVTALTNPVFAEDKNLLSFIANLTLTQSLGLFNQVTWNGPSWSISVEFYTYILWAFMLVIFRKNLWVILSISFGFIAWFIVVHNGSIIYTYDYGFIRCFYSFLIGMLAYQVSTRFIINFDFIKGSVIESFILACLLLIIPSFTHSQSWAMPFLFAFVIIIFAKESGIISQILNKNRFSFLGKLSYSYYLNHTVVLAIMDLLIFKLIKLPHSTTGELTYVIGSLSIIHVLSVFTHRYIELIWQSNIPKNSPKSTTPLVTSR